MPDGLLRHCDWRISVEKQSDSLRLSSSTELYTASVSLNRETRQERKRASGAESLKNVGTASRSNPPTWWNHVSVFSCVCVCVHRHMLTHGYPHALTLFLIAFHEFLSKCTGMWAFHKEEFTLASLKFVQAAACEPVFKGWCSHLPVINTQTQTEKCEN